MNKIMRFLFDNLYAFFLGAYLSKILPFSGETLGFQMILCLLIILLVNLRGLKIFKQSFLNVLFIDHLFLLTFILMIYSLGINIYSNVFWFGVLGLYSSVVFFKKKIF